MINKLTFPPLPATSPAAAKQVPVLPVIDVSKRLPQVSTATPEAAPPPIPVTSVSTQETNRKRDKGTSLRAMTFNVRWDDEELQEEKHAWKQRKERVVRTIGLHKPDLIGLQEPFTHQLTDLISALPDYECYRGIGLPCENQQRAYNPIFYRKERFELFQSGFFFLSQTPNQPSLGWTASIPRSVSWVYLKDRYTNKEFFFFNTHFDYLSKLARDESARLLRQKIGEIAGKKPFLVAGDFNIFPDIGGEETLYLLTEAEELGMPLLDAQKISETPHSGPTGSWSGFKEAGEPGIKPDFLFVGPQVIVLTHAILSDTFEGEFASDHLPVMVDVSL